VLTYQVEQDEIDRINSWAGFKLTDDLEFSHHHYYDNSRKITCSIAEQPYVHHTVEQAGLAVEVRKEALKSQSIGQLIGVLEGLSLNPNDAAFLANLQKQFPAGDWNNRLAYHIWLDYLAPYVPKFLYFDDYYLLPGKISLVDLQQRVQGVGGRTLREEDKTALSLLRLASVDLNNLTQTSGYEPIKAKLEGISNSITDRIFEYWTQNRELDVEFDIRQDLNDDPPFNQGNNLYIRIRNRRHRVTVPFSQRSKGFIWFFSFITWFDSIQQDQSANTDLVLLLDEPGLSLHALAQQDFLRYIDELSQDHQILYTTHSPFMVHSERLDEVRTVEDRQQQGT
jgi:hypothetical protein